MVGRLTPYLVEVRQGDSFDIVMRFKDGCSKPIDISGWSVKMQTRDKASNASIFVVDGEIVDALAGLAVIKLSSTQTNVAAKDYNTDIQAVVSNGGVHTVYPQDVNKVATFRITQQITE